MDGFPVLGVSWKYRAQGNHSDVINVLLILGGKTRKRVLLLSWKYLAEISKSAEAMNLYPWLRDRKISRFHIPRTIKSLFDVIF